MVKNYSRVTETVYIFSYLLEEKNMNCIKNIVLISALLPSVSLSMHLVTTRKFRKKRDHTDEIIKKYEGKDHLPTALMGIKFHADITETRFNVRSSVPYRCIRKWYTKDGAQTRIRCGTSPEILNGYHAKEVAENYIKKDDEIMKLLGWMESKTTTEKADAIVMWYGSWGSLFQSFLALEKQAVIAKLPEYIFFILPSYHQVIPKEDISTINKLINEMSLYYGKTFAPQFTDETKPKTMHAVLNWLIDLFGFLTYIKHKRYTTIDNFQGKLSEFTENFSLFTASSSYNYDLEQMLTKCIIPDHVRIVKGCCYFYPEIETISGEGRDWELVSRNYRLNKIFFYLNKMDAMKKKWKSKEIKLLKRCYVTPGYLLENDKKILDEIKQNYKRKGLEVARKILTDKGIHLSDIE